MKNNKKVTIMIPTYNQSQYIEKAIESALFQTYQNKQILVLDDCSTDNTGELLTRYREKNEIEYIRHQENIGRVNNYRTGLYSYAQGDWVINLDGDDFFIDKYFIENAVKLAEEDEEIVLVTADRVEGGMKKSSELQNPTTEIAENFGKIVDGNLFFLGIPSKKYQLFHLTSLYRREQALELDFYSKDIISSDYESLYRLILGHKVGILSQKVAVWRIHGENESRTKDLNKLVSNYSMFESVREYAKEKQVFNILNLWLWYLKAVSKKFYTNILSLLRDGRKAELVKFIYRIARKYPVPFLLTIFNPKLYIKVFLVKK